MFSFRKMGSLFGRKFALTTVLSLSLLFSVAFLEFGVQYGLSVAQGGAPGCGDVNDDKVVNISDAVYLLNRLFGGGEALKCQAIRPPPECLLATGQTDCWNTGGTVIDCDDEFYAGQDGFYQMGFHSDERFVDHKDGTITDTYTGLMWQTNTADLDEDGVVNLANEDVTTWRQALLYCDELTFAEHDDWRLPNVRELYSLVDHGLLSPPIHPVFGAAPGIYWSSTTWLFNPTRAYRVSFAMNGGVRPFQKGNLFHLRAVRGSPSN